jgi:outer membrane scaffolding protein for murein synthesis (MipA/OmpV family)
MIFWQRRVGRTRPCRKGAFRRGPRAPLLAPLLASRLALFLVVVPPAVQGAELPLWEAGVGVGVVDFPDYRGSDYYHTYVLPIPYFVYRGEFLKVDRDSLRARFFDSPDVQLDVSVNGSVPVKSSEDQTRAGMPNLDPSLEIGPALDVTLLRAEGERIKLDLRLPVRTAEGSNFYHVENIGWISQPALNLDIADPPGWSGARLGLQAAALFADRRFLEYFYGVAPAYATPERPAYAAHGGYAGSQFTLALSKRYPGLWVGGFLKWDSLRGAVFEDSPLVRRRSFGSAGVAVSWILGKSETLVEAEY